MVSMKLFYSSASPYARKVRIVAREKNLHAAIAEVLVNTADDPVELLQNNPLGKIPALVRDDDTALFDSPVICDFLDSTGSGERLIPTQGAERWQVLRAEALADGLLDAAVACVVEGRRPPHEQSPSAVARQQEKIVRAVDAMVQELAQLPAGFGLGQIAFVCALGYLDLRHPQIDWREQQPLLGDWYAQQQSRPSVQDTVPQ